MDRLNPAGPMWAPPFKAHPENRSATMHSMAKRSVKAILDEAQNALAAAAEDELLAAYKTRYKNPGWFLKAIQDFDGAQFWREAGASSLEEYVSIALPLSDKDEWRGWAALSKIKYNPEILGLVKRGSLRPIKLAPARNVISQKNYKTWVFLALHLSRPQLARAAREWQRLAKSGYRGRAVFVPLWIPVKDYRKVVKRIGIQKDHDGTAWEWLRLLPNDAQGDEPK